MITIPWQIAAAFIFGNLIVIAVLIVQLGHKADRSTQARNELVRATRQQMADGLKQGHEIYLDMWCVQKLKQQKKEV